MTSETAIRGVLCGLATTLACNTRTMIGEVPDGAPSTDTQQTSYDPVGTSGHTCAPPQFPGDHPFDFPAGVEGVWTGYVEGGTLGISSDAVRLTLDHAADGTNKIHLVYGVAAAPPPATSATDFYPPGTDPNGPAFTGSPIEGFPYTAHNVDWQAFGQQWRLRFLIDHSEPWASWCQLQPSYAAPYPGGVEYNCLPNAGGAYLSSGVDAGSTCYLSDSSGRPAKYVSCAQLQLCTFNRICACDQCGCDMQGQPFDGVPSGPGAFDILFDASTANGSSLHLIPAAN